MEKKSKKLSVKQQYEAPLTRVVRLQSERMLAQSGGLGQPSPYPTQPDPLGF